MVLYYKEVSGLKIKVPHGLCSFVNKKPESITIETLPNKDLPLNNRVTIVSSGVLNTFLLNDDFDLSQWRRISPRIMAYKHM